MMRWRQWLRIGLATFTAVGVLAFAGQCAKPQGGSVAYATGAPGIVSDYALTLTVEGTQQGKIEGDQTRDGSLRILGYSHEVISPRDAGSGQATGRRQHSPLIIRKRIDKSTPLLMRAMVTNETLRDVTLRLTDIHGSGYTITLTNASIASIRQSGEPGEMPVEEIAFTYQRITWTWVDGGITADDDWEARK